MACALTKATSKTSPRRRSDVSRKGDNQFARKSGDVAATSPAVAATSPQSPWSPAGLGDVAETSPQSRTKLVSATSPQLMGTSWRRLRDMLETGKCLPKSKMFEFPATPRRPCYVSEMSPQPAAGAPEAVLDWGGGGAKT